eukprot:IDg3320t1
MVAWQIGMCSRSKACLHQLPWGLENGAKSRSREPDRAIGNNTTARKKREDGKG